jgi:signal transduction histidine kinase
MNFFKPQQQRQLIVTVVYWVLLVYMIAALLYWYTALEKQNGTISSIKTETLKKDDPEYFNKVVAIEDARKRKTMQYIGEGSTFLALIILGAVFVFRATRRQLRISQQQQNFMMAITHELKTPIAITQLNLETLQKRKLDEEKQQKLISNTLQEANRLNTLCSNILLAAQLDSGIYTASKTEINFSDLVEGCIDDFTNRYPQRKITEQVTESIYLVGESLQLQILINNLLENALKYSPKESNITILLGSEQGKIRLSVIDEGKGIADAEKRHVFEKFYRSGNENTRNAKGTGLGLYLCKKIAENHGGNISAVDNQPRGTNFTIVFKEA